MHLIPTTVRQKRVIGSSPNRRRAHPSHEKKHEGKKPAAVAEEEKKKKKKKMMMKRIRREEGRELGVGSLVAMRVPITGGGLELRRDATLCVLIASCTRRRRRYVQRREPTYRTRSRGPIGHCNDQSSFDILSPCFVLVCAKPPRWAHGAICMYACTHTCGAWCRGSIHRNAPVTTTTVITTTQDAIESTSDTRLPKHRGIYATLYLACIGSRPSTGLLL